MRLAGACYGTWIAIARKMKTKCNLIQYCLLWAVLFAGLAAEAQPVITQQPTNQTVISGNTAAFIVSVSGTGPFTYQWQFNGTNMGIGIITTVAGNGSNYIFSGDGGAATNAALNLPNGIAIDVIGNLFIADQNNNRIRKVSTNGIITTVAGNGTQSFSGDSGSATNAALNYPASVAVDASGNMFIADQNNNRIRKVSTNGIITTVAGCAGTGGYSGDGGVATNEALYGPSGVSVDTNGNLFIADVGNNRIRKVSTNGIITTVAGNGTSRYTGDGGAATNAALNYPSGISVDASGNLFIADKYNQRIRKVNANGIITTIAGNGSYSFSGDGGAATNATLFDPENVAVDATGNLFIADCINQRIRKVDTNGIITTIAGNGNPSFSGDGGIATNAAMWGPSAVATDASGNQFIVDSDNNRIRKVTTYGQLTSSLLINHISQTNAGNYSVIIANSSGSVTSSAANLTVIPAIITQQPSNQLALLGSAASFIVRVSNVAPVAYQWYLINLASAGVTAQMLSGFVYGSTITNGGSGYTTVPSVQFIGGGGSGAGGTASITNGQVITITITNTGSGYTSSPAVLIDPPTGLLVGQTNATLNLSTITTNNADGYYVVITNIYGSITSSVAILTIAYPPSISQQPQNQTAGAGSVANFNVTAAGTSPFGYQWWLTGGQQSNATAVPFVINGFVLAASMTSGGAGYLTIPTVQFVGGSGSGASGTAVVSNRMVTVINMVSPGSGYTTPPIIQIAAPTDISLIGQTNSVLNLLAVANTNAGNYYVVVTNNYGSVTSILASLTVALPGYNQISSPVLNNGKMSLSFVGIGGGNYALDRSFSLSPANWIPQVTNPADVNGILTFTNTPDFTTNNFWRIRSVP